MNVQPLKIKHTLRRSLIAGAVALILVPIILLGAVSGLIIRSTVSAQSEQAYRQTVQQIISSVEARTNVVEAMAASLRGNQRICFILRHLIHDKVSLGKEYDYYKEIRQSLDDLVKYSGAANVRIANRGRATFIKPYFSLLPETILTDEFPESAPRTGWLLPGTLSDRIVSDTGNLIYCLEMIDFMGNNEHQGYLLIEIRPKDFFSVLGDSWEEGVHLDILQDAQPIFRAGAAHASEGYDVHVVSGRVEKQNWEVCLSVPLRQVQASGERVRNELMLIAVVLSGIAVVLALVYTHRINRRLGAILTAIRRMEGGEYGLCIPIEGNDEYTVVQTALNQMSVGTRRLLDSLEEAQKQQKAAEMRALYEQINPHFIYNTLDIIRWQAMAGDTQSQVELAEALTSYLSLSLNHGREITTVENEIREITQYMQIMNFRYRGAIDFTTQVEKGLEKRAVIKLILQPIVENAVMHGVMCRDDKHGFIRVSVRSEEEGFVYTVEDNGAGMPQEKADTLLREKQEDHYGLFSVYSRLVTFYGPACRMTIRSAVGEGCLVTIRIPR